MLCDGVRVSCWGDGVVVYSPGSAETVLLAPVMASFLKTLVASETVQYPDLAYPEVPGDLIANLVRQHAIKAVS